jgi:hypothetical protein
MKYKHFKKSLSVLLAVAVFCGVLTSGWLTTAAIIDIDIEAEMELEIPMETMSTPTIANGVYFIQNRHSGRFLDVRGGAGMGSGTLVIQHGYNGATNQQWRVEHTGSNAYSINPMSAPSTSLYPDNINNLSPVRIVTTSTIPEINRRWMIIQNNNGSFRLRPSKTVLFNDKVLAIQNASMDNDGRGILWDYEPHTVPNDEWIFIRACDRLGRTWGSWRITKTPTCLEDGRRQRDCTRFGCPFPQNEPIVDPNAHRHINRVCRNITTITLPILGEILTGTCGHIQNPVSGGFTHYMYRGDHTAARHIAEGWLDYTDHRAIDIRTTIRGESMGWAIYAQGPGLVTDRSGAAGSGIRGHFIEISYDAIGGNNNNRYRARYLHMRAREDIPANSGDASRVTHTRKIGETGNRGAEATSGGHLHFDVQRISNSQMIPPTTLFPRCGCAGTIACNSNAHLNQNTFSGRNHFIR